MAALEAVTQSPAFAEQLQRSLASASPTSRDAREALFQRLLGHSSQRPLKLWKDGFAERTLRRQPQQTAAAGADGDYEDLCAARML
jgi:hypothetical protein